MRKVTEKRILVEVEIAADPHMKRGPPYDIRIPLISDSAIDSIDGYLVSKLVKRSKKLEAQIQREVLEGLREKVEARITELEKSKAECMADDETLWTPDYEGRLMEAKLIQKLVESVRNSRR